MTPNPNFKRRGFASLTPERRKEVARKGGQSVPSENRSFSKDRTLASKAGSKGGQTARKPKENRVGRPD
jgi:general stress protein YciG